MKKKISILFLFFLFSSSLLAKEDICERIITDGDYQEYLDDLPSSDFYSAFHVAVGNDGRCSYGWDWWETNRPLELVIQDSFNDCEKYRKKKNIDVRCKPYDINTKIVWNNPNIYKELLSADKSNNLKLFEEIQQSKVEEDINSLDLGMWGLSDTIMAEDPSTFKKIIYIGEKTRKILEARTNRKDNSRRFNFKTLTYVFDAYFENGKIFEILIYFENEKNKGQVKAESLAKNYAFMLGQMPNVLLQRLDAAHIYADVKGISNAGAHTRVINIHLLGENGYRFGSSIQELFIHELVHASLDKPSNGVYRAVNKKRHKNDTIKSVKLNWGHWRKAVKEDKKRYITKYAKTNMHEDLAESFGSWLALRYRGDRISDSQKYAIEKLIPNRIKFFDEQKFDMFPLILSN